MNLCKKKHNYNVEREVTRGRTLQDDTNILEWLGISRSFPGTCVAPWEGLNLHLFITDLEGDLSPIPCNNELYIALTQTIKINAQIDIK